MALAANTFYEIRTVLPTAPMAMVAGAGPIFNGALVTIQGAAAEPYGGTETDLVPGWHFGDTVGTAVTLQPGDVASNLTHCKIIPGGFMIKELPVTGVADDATDYGDLVYATDDGTYTLTATSNLLVGYVVADADRSAGNATVYMNLRQG